MAYFDVVVDKDFMPIEGTNLPENELPLWLRFNTQINVPGNMVVIGRTLNLVTIDEYLGEFRTL